MGLNAFYLRLLDVEVHIVLDFAAIETRERLIVDQYLVSHLGGPEVDGIDRLLRYSGDEVSLNSVLGIILFSWAFLEELINIIVEVRD